MPKPSRKSEAAALDLPPPFTLVTLREVGDAFAHACEIAAKDGAGTLVYVGRFDLAEFAVVLEPDEPLRRARRAMIAGMTALTDALLAFAPPERMVTIDWPDAIRIDGGLVGGGRLGWPKDAPEDQPPDWLVFGGIIRTVAMGEGEPGLHPLTSALEHEGFGDTSSAELVESFARNLMVHTDAWERDGFPMVAKDFISRLPREAGLRREIDGNGDLVMKRPGKPDERRALLPSLASPSWWDAEKGGLRA